MTAEQALSKFEGVVVKLLRHYGVPSSNWEDCMQEGRLGILRGLNSYNPDSGASLFTWVYTHVRGAVRDYRKSCSYSLQPRNPSYSLGCYGTVGAAVKDDYHLEEQAVLEKLSSCRDGLRKQFIVNKLLEGYNHKEIAELLHVGQSRMSQLIFDIRKDISCL